MKIPSSPAVLLRSARKQKNLQVSALAARAELSCQRLCDYESGARHVPEAHLKRLCQALDLPLEQVLEETAWSPGAPGRPARPFESLAIGSFSSDLPFLPERTRDFAFRLRSAWARYRQTLSRMQPSLEKRPDLAELTLFLRDFPADSPLEAVFDVGLVALGGGPAMVAPARLGFHDLEVIDPRTEEYVGHRRRPALVLPVPTGSIVFLPQVGVVAEKLRPILDHLVGVAAEGRVSWSVVELDGAQHDPEADEARDRAVGLPVLRLRAEHLESRQFPGMVPDWLLRRHDLARPALGGRVAARAHRVETTGPTASLETRAAGPRA